MVPLVVRMVVGVVMVTVVVVLVVVVVVAAAVVAAAAAAAAVVVVVVARSIFKISTWKNGPRPWSFEHLEDILRLGLAAVPGFKLPASELCAPNPREPTAADSRRRRKLFNSTTMPGLANFLMTFHDEARGPGGHCCSPTSPPKTLTEDFQGPSFW